ncbi:MAG: hypothetical protein R3277_12335 [Brumimicrobium sp.]|nr:hypothetical protein [Brumimicrobium sp.]
MKRNLILLFFIACSFSACRKDKVKSGVIIDSDCPEEISFSGDILPIINNNCNTSGCHNAAAQSGGYVFETHAQISADATIMSDVMHHEGGFLPMPQGQPKLDDSLLLKFDCWVKQGKQNN